MDAKIGYRLTGDAIVDPVNGNHNASYEYDEVGNRIYETINGVQTQYIIDSNDRLSQQGGTSYQYDDNGNTINETQDGITTSYTYDSRNRLIATDKGGAQIDMAYDPDGIRVQKVVDGEATDYLVDSNRAYAQVLVERSGVTELGYTFGTDLVGLDTGSESYSYQTDALGSTRLLSDGNGLVADTPAFDAWGVQLAGGDVSENQYLFTGEQFDSELDKVYLRARYMAVDSGRFTQMDEFPGLHRIPATLNKYTYANGDPSDFTDPSGYVVGGLGGLSLNFGASLRSAVSIGRLLGRVAKAAYLSGKGSTSFLLAEMKRCRVSKGKKCRLPNIVVNGSDYPESQAHIADAILGMGSGILPISPRVTYKKGGVGPKGWYSKLPQCKNKTKLGTNLQCDEFPFSTTKEGSGKITIDLVFR